MATALARYRNRNRPSPDAPDDRPLKPMQMFGAGFLFGSLAAGVLSALNFRRLGRPDLGGLSVALGLFGMFAVVGVVCVVPDAALRPACLMMFLAAGCVAKLTQRPAFDAWFAKHHPNEPEAKYVGNRLPLVIGIGAACLAVQVGACLAALALVGR